MIYEIGAFLHKGEGGAMAAKFAEDGRVLGAYVETARTTDLFRFREFGSASENDILTLIVPQAAADAIFDELAEAARFDEPQTGIIFRLPLQQRSSVDEKTG